ncbi:hypothetical protein LY78DRAFT_683273 [Colletotrichum sublineola]|nr:hypothetical protein LY78DRAFT_683273 [Colletotrichum sublineola]
MKLSLSTVLVAAACVHEAAALHINFHETINCSDNYFTCVNWPRNTCCDPNIARRTFRSVNFVNLDTTRNWNLRVYNGGGCTRQTASDGHNRRRNVCFRREPPYTGASWGPFTRRRDEEGGVDGAAPSARCGRPQQLTFVDGTQLNLTSLNDADYAKIRNLAFEVHSADELPEEFQQYKIVACVPSNYNHMDGRSPDCLGHVAQVYVVFKLELAEGYPEINPLQII